MRKTLILLLISVVLQGCNKPEPKRTISYYETHKKERKTKVAKCNDDPGRARDDPNCINAIRVEGLNKIAEEGCQNAKDFGSEKLIKEMCGSLK